MTVADEDGWTSLFHAVKQGNCELAKYLVKQKANLNAIINDGSTVLHTAAFGGNLDIVKYLIEEKGANANATIIMAELLYILPLTATTQI